MTRLDIEAIYQYFFKFRYIEASLIEMALMSLGELLLHYIVSPYVFILYMTFNFNVVSDNDTIFKLT